MNTNPKEAALFAQLWLESKPTEIESHKSALVEAIELGNTVGIIEARDQIERLLNDADGITKSLDGKIDLKKRGRTRRTLFPLLDPMSDYEHRRRPINVSPFSSKEISQQSESEKTLHRLGRFIEETRKWLLINLPDEYRDGFGDEPGDSRNPVPARPLPGGSSFGATVELPDASPAVGRPFVGKGELGHPAVEVRTA